MKLRTPVLHFALSLALLACEDNIATSNKTQVAANTDTQLQSRVAAAIAGASDLPAGLQVSADNGKVIISGSLQCKDCGGMRTPANIGTIQQSLGAIVRAVPGVHDLQFELSHSQ